MSRVGKTPVTIPAGVSVKISGSVLTVSGPHGELKHEIPEGISTESKGSAITFSRSNESKHTRALHGTTRSHLANMVEGVLNGYKKELEISGVGFKAQLQGQKLVLNVGFSHPVEYFALDGVKIACTSDTALVVSGPDKQKVGQVAARIRGFRKAEPYKGKGIYYKGEQIRRKAGKTVA